MRGYCTGILFYYGWSLKMSPTVAHLHENEPHPLQDGLLISTPEDIRAQVATWTVLVIIESPTPPQGISEKLTNFKHVLELL